MYAVTAYWLDLLSDLDASTQVHTLLQQAHVYSCQVTFTSSPWSLGHFTPPFDASTYPCILAVCRTTSATVHMTPLLVLDWTQFTAILSLLVPVSPYETNIHMISAQSFKAPFVRFCLTDTTYQRHHSKNKTVALSHLTSLLLSFSLQ